LICEVVARESRPVRCGIKRQVVARHNIDPVGRNEVAAERFPRVAASGCRQRIVDEGRELREIAAAHLVGWNGVEGRLRLNVAEMLAGEDDAAALGEDWLRW